MILTISHSAKKTRRVSQVVFWYDTPRGLAHLIVIESECSWVVSGEERRGMQDRVERDIKLRGGSEDSFSQLPGELQSVKRRENGELFNGYGVSVLQAEKALQTGCTAV